MSAMAQAEICSSSRRIVSSAVLGTVVFLISEVMLFCALISAYIVLRGQSGIWPPLDQPRLPAVATGANTCVLIASGLFMWRSLAAIENADRIRFRRELVTAFVLGALFLVGQGTEWIFLVRYGLTTTSSVYGALFYTIVGCHGLHVAAALAVLGFVLIRAVQGYYEYGRRDGLRALRLYWTFVVGIWPPLYGLVYLW